MKKTNEHKKPLCLAFIGYEQASDSAENIAELKCDSRRSRRGKVSCNFETHNTEYSDHQASYRHRKVSIQKEVGEDNTITSKLLQLSLQDISKKFSWISKGIEVGSKYFSNVRFQNDIVLFSAASDDCKAHLKN